MPFFHTMLFVAFFGARPCLAADTSFGLEPLRDGLDWAMGCKCAVTNAKGDSFAVSALEDKASVIIRTHGERVELAKMGSDHHIGKTTTGDIFTRAYRDRAHKLTLTFKATIPCGGAEGDECEKTHYAVDAALDLKGKTSELKNLRGLCGCIQNGI